jgi:non-homologous end joining protein Ku
MFYEDDVKALPKNYTRPEVGEQELTMAKTLIDSIVIDLMDALKKSVEQNQKTKKQGA